MSDSIISVSEEQIGVSVPFTSTVIKVKVEPRRSVKVKVDIPGLIMPLALDIEIDLGGVRLMANDISLAYLDLYYLDAEPEAPFEPDLRVLQMVIDDSGPGANGDPVAFARYTDKGTRVCFENSVEQVEDQPIHGAAWGYDHKEGK